MAVRSIDSDTLSDWMDNQQEFVLIDVMARESYQESHLPGAVNVPLDENFDQKIEEMVPDKNKTVVVYCGSLQCNASPKAAARLVDLGYTNVYDYEEGKAGWEQAGMSLAS